MYLKIIHYSSLVYLLKWKSSHALGRPDVKYVESHDNHLVIYIFNIKYFNRGHPRGWFGNKSFPKLADFSLSWAEGEEKMYRIYRVCREVQSLDQNFSLKSLQNFSLSESSRMTPV